MTALPTPCICLVTSRQVLAPEARTERDGIVALERFLDEAIDGAVDVIQLRERDLDGGVLLSLTRRVLARAAGTSVRVLVNDRVDVAQAAGADGVHLRADSPPSAVVRDLVGPSAILGRSIHSIAETSDVADLFVFGTVFPSGSKRPDAPIVGVTALAEVVGRARVPVLAIGGVTPERVPEVRATGAAGVAAIGVFLPPGRAPGALGPAAATRELRAVWAEIARRT